MFDLTTYPNKIGNPPAKNNTIKASSVEMLTYCDIGMMVCVDYKGRNGTQFALHCI